MYGSSEMGNVCAGDDAVTNRHSVSSDGEGTAVRPDFVCVRREPIGGKTSELKSKIAEQFVFLLPCSDGRGLHSSGTTAKEWTAAEEVSGPSSYTVISMSWRGLAAPFLRLIQVVAVGQKAKE